MATRSSTAKSKTSTTSKSKTASKAAPRRKTAAKSTAQAAAKPAAKANPKTTTKTAAKTPTKTPTKTPVKTTAKTPAPKPSVTAAAKAAVKPATAVVSKLEPVVSGPALRKKELIDTVARTSGLKRADVKKVVEAMLVEMGLALQDSRDLNLQPFGNVKINRERKLAEGRVLAARIRQARDLPTEAAPEEAPKAAE